jgi:hypothetical protein
MAQQDLTAFIEAVKKEAEGRWRFIFGALCSKLNLAIDTFDKHKSRQVPDPITGAGKTRFCLMKKWEQNGAGIFSPYTPDDVMDGWQLLMECNTWSFMDCINEVGELLNVKRSKFGFGQYTAATKQPAAAPVVPEVEVDHASIQKHKNKMVRFWKPTYHLDAPEAEIARVYLLSRGIKAVRQKWVKFHPAAYYYDELTKSYSYHPAIVCAVQDSEGKTTTIYRYYLTADGKKLTAVNGVEIEDGKKPMGLPNGMTISGSSTILGEMRSDGLVFMVEGLETGFSVFQQYGYQVPVIVGHTANGMLQADLPTGTKAVVIFTDRDVSKIENGKEKGYTGQRTSIQLKAHLIEEGINALWTAPGAEVKDGPKGADWNDAANQGGKFPALDLIKAKLGL